MHFLIPGVTIANQAKLSLTWLNLRKLDLIYFLIERYLKLKKALLMTELIYVYEIYKEKLKKNNCRWEKMSKAMEENSLYGN